MSSWLSTQPAVILSHVRSGSTLLAHLLSTHPQISCPRAEPLEPRSVWRKTWPGATGPEILNVVLTQWGFGVSAAKLTTKHLTPEVEAYLVSKRARILCVWRENVVRTAFSAILHTRYRRSQLKVSMEHRLTPPSEVARVSIDPDLLLKQCHRIVSLQKRLQKTVARMALPNLQLTYAQITGGQEAHTLSPVVNRQICEFLGVEDYQMTATLRRLNPKPLSAMLINWEAVERAVKSSEFARWLTDDEG